MWGLPVGEKQNEIELTVDRPRAPTRPGIRARRSGELHERDVLILDRVPITTRARTLLDLAAILPLDWLECVLAEAQSRDLVTVEDVVDQIERNRGRRGVPALRRLLELERGPGLTRSEAERKMLTLVRAADLPAPMVNARWGRYELDFLWPDQRLVVEIDGYAYHTSRCLRARSGQGCDARRRRPHHTTGHVEAAHELARGGDLAPRRGSGRPVGRTVPGDASRLSQKAGAGVYSAASTASRSSTTSPSSRTAASSSYGVALFVTTAIRPPDARVSSGSPATG
jgi:hypothetical protein